MFFIFVSCTEKQENKNQQSEIVLLSKKISKEPNNIKLLLDRVDYNLSKNNYESAIYDLKQCVILDSLNADIRYKLGNSYFNLSKKSQKIEHINSSILHLEKLFKLIKKLFVFIITWRNFFGI